MGIRFDDDSFINVNDWDAIKAAILGEGDKPNPRKITEIVSKDGVKIKVDNLQPKKKPKEKPALAQPDYVSGSYKGWTIRVWKQMDESVYGCNYFKGEDTRFFQYSLEYSENDVFRYARTLIDGIINE
jgi:hypothetical protein